MRVFLSTTSLLSSYGGPAFSVSRLATALAGEGAEVGLWAADQSAQTTPLLPSDCKVRRLVGAEADALECFGRPDILHDSGIWLRHNHRFAVLAHQRSIPRVVNLRGMLEPWALNHKRLKKRIAWSSYQRRDLQQACCHFATSQTEAQNLQKLGLGVPVVTIPNGVDVPELSSARGKAAGIDENRSRTALFLGRIYPVKGLPMLVEAWSRVRPQGWLLKIAGPDEAGHRKQVEKAVATARLGDAISFVGPVEGESKRSAFLDADLFILPTQSESFGVVVAEALAHCLPVLTTTGAPWSVLPEKKCGWWVDASIDGLEQGLRQATLLDRRTLRAMGADGRAFVANEYSWDRVAKLTLSSYADVLNGVQSRPQIGAVANAR